MKPLSERTGEDVLQWDKQGHYWYTENGEEWTPNEMLVYATQLEAECDDYRNLYHMAEAKVLSRDSLLEQLSEEQLTQDLAKAEAENEKMADALATAQVFAIELRAERDDLEEHWVNEVKALKKIKRVAKLYLEHGEPELADELDDLLTGESDAS